LEHGIVAVVLFLRKHSEELSQIRAENLRAWQGEHARSDLFSKISHAQKQHQKWLELANAQEKT
jgi:hypothetical protein